ncbi:MAG: DUF4293 family protein [Flavobacteriales bacterium]|nr:DUF4293 family protein [Flavobacteriales bacterium]
MLLARVVVGIYLYTESAINGCFDGEPQMTRGIAAYLPLIGLVCNFLAYRAILKDERLVRSVDRLR